MSCIDSHSILRGTSKKNSQHLLRSFYWALYLFRPSMTEREKRNVLTKPAVSTILGPGVQMEAPGCLAKEEKQSLQQTREQCCSGGSSLLTSQPGLPGAQRCTSQCGVGRWGGRSWKWGREQPQGGMQCPRPRYLVPNPLLHPDPPPQPQKKRKNTSKEFEQMKFKSIQFHKRMITNNFRKTSSIKPTTKIKKTKRKKWP